MLRGEALINNLKGGETFAAFLTYNHKTTTMKKVLFFIIIAMLSWFYDATPSSFNELIIVKYEPIRPYEKIWSAVCQYESKNNPNAYNPKEMATGIVQIRPIRIKDYNQRTGKSYTIDDCFKVEISKEIFIYFANKFQHDEPDKIAKDWNKCKTDNYWKKVKRFM
jgi:hypothetical protein